MNVLKATRKFEKWLAERTRIVKADLDFKHQQMARAAFPFLRATFYRWVQVWPEVCADLNHAPRVLAVGDLHLENFGTWRDVEGRLVWGVNDFDEAARMPYTIDLVRLAASALLAIEEGNLALKARAACEAICQGYEDCMQAGGRPFILEEEHRWLRELSTGVLRDPVTFWGKICGLLPATGKVPRSARRALERLLPRPNRHYQLLRRRSGLGSLGRVRLVAIADWQGGKVAREAKAVVESAIHWLQNRPLAREILCHTITRRAVRCPDPFFQVNERWILRRLSPQCSRIELADLPGQRDELRLLHAMGWETANIHLGSGKSVKAVRRHLRSQKAGWLPSAAGKMAKSVAQDWSDWRKENRNWKNADNA
jgi:hypothetical protein